MPRHSEQDYSDEVKDIISESPNWMMKWGIVTILLLLFALLFGSYLYKYPDIIVANVTITTSNPPISMLGKVNGKIDTVVVENGQSVMKNDVLVLIQNPANYEDIKELKSITNRLSSWLFLGGDPIETTIRKKLSVGALQEYYSSLLEDYEFYIALKNNKYFIHKLESYKKQLDLHQAQLRNTMRQNEILKKELSLSKKQFSRDSLLYSQGVNSEQDFESANRSYLQKLYTFQTTETNFTDLKLRYEQLKQEILEMEHSQHEQEEGLQRSLQKQLSILEAQLSSWEELYVIKAPVDGQASLSKFHSAGLNTSVGEIVISVIPKNSSNLVVRAEAKMKNAGKLENGLRVNIKLENYPYLEYGFLRGTVTDISPLPEDKVYYFSIDLDQGLETTLKKKLKLSQRMGGTAEVITKDKRLIERILDPILTLLTQ